MFLDKNMFVNEKKYTNLKIKLNVHSPSLYKFALQEKSWVLKIM